MPSHPNVLPQIVYLPNSCWFFRFTLKIYITVMLLLIDLFEALLASRSLGLTKGLNMLKVGQKVLSGLSMRSYGQTRTNFMANPILDLGKYREPSSTSRQTVLHNTKLAALKVRPQTSSQQQYVGTCQSCKFSA